jgi:hypothetical protein
MSGMAEQHPLVGMAARCAPVGAALAAVAIFGLLDTWAADPLGLLTYDASNALPWPLSTLLVGLPHALAAALAGHLLARRLRAGCGLLFAASGAALLWYGLAHWQHTVLLLDRVAALDMSIEALVVPAGFLGGYAFTRSEPDASTLRAKEAPRFFDIPLLCLALAMVGVVLVEWFVLPYAARALFATVHAMPLPIAPLWLSLAQGVAYGGSGFAIRRWRLLRGSESALLLGFSCAVHAALWVWGAAHTATLLAYAVVWLPLPIMVAAYGLGWWLARRHPAVSGIA